MNRNESEISHRGEFTFGEVYDRIKIKIRSVCEGVYMSENIVKLEHVKMASAVMWALHRELDINPDEWVIKSVRKISKISEIYEFVFSHHGKYGKYRLFAVMGYFDGKWKILDNITIYI